MDARLALQRSALVAEALIALVVAVGAVIAAFVPQCGGISAFPGSPGGRFCNTFLSRGGPLLIGIAILAVAITIIDVLAALRSHPRVSLMALIVQVPVAIGAGILGVIWIGGRAPTGIVFATAALVLAGVIVITFAAGRGLKPGDS
jgi:hypothetical protein